MGGLGRGLATTIRYVMELPTTSALFWFFDENLMVLEVCFVVLHRLVVLTTSGGLSTS